MATSNNTLNTRIKWKRDTSANWTNNNPIILNGEIIIVDTAEGEVRFKIGNGVKTYTQLPFEDEVVRNLITNKSDVGHTHTIESIEGLRGVIDTAILYTSQELTDDQKTQAKSNIGASDVAHKHSASDIISGTLGVARGGTGYTSIVDSTYTTARYRASALVSTETNPTQNGVINWMYE